MDQGFSYSCFLRLCGFASPAPSGYSVTTKDSNQKARPAKMKVVTSEEMRRIDRVTIEQRRVPGLELMNRAGAAVAREALARFEPDSVAIVTGKGNNAGDGFVVARELMERNLPVTVFMLAPPESLQGDALLAFQRMGKAHVILEPSLDLLREELKRYDLIVDAIFGTGLNGPVRAPWDAAIEVINAAGVNVLAIDSPSGLPADPGVEIGAHIRAAATVTIGLPKVGMLLDPGVRATGEVTVAEIGFDADLLTSEELTINLTTPREAAALLPDRRAGGHKGTFGNALIFGGSPGMTGAAVLAARAAARSGVGKVYVAYPEALGAIFETLLIEPVKLPLGGEDDWFHADQAEAAVMAALDMQAVAIGPGLGQHKGTRKFLYELIERVSAPMVIDADGLNLLAAEPGRLERRAGPTILTPHPGEAARLLGKTTAKIEANRLEAMAEFAAWYRVTIVLKGAQTIITDSGGIQRSINPTGNSGLAKGGSGDVLTGLLAGLLAQGLGSEEAAKLAVFMHGMAADFAAAKLGVRAMLPSDVIDHFGAAFLALEKLRHA